MKTHLLRALIVAAPLASVAGTALPCATALRANSFQTVAEESIAHDCGCRCLGVAGPSWSIPGAASVLAPGWQVDSQATAERAVGLLRPTAQVRDGAKIINPVALIGAVKATKKPFQADGLDIGQPGGTSDRK